MCNTYYDMSLAQRLLQASSVASGGGSSRNAFFSGLVGGGGNSGDQSRNPADSQPTIGGGFGSAKVAPLLLDTGNNASVKLGRKLIADRK